MQFTISLQNIITIGSALGVLVALLKFYNKALRMIDHQKEQDKKIKNIDDGQTVILQSLLGVLRGQVEQGCDGPVKAALNNLEQYLLERGANHDN